MNIPRTNVASPVITFIQSRHLLSGLIVFVTIVDHSNFSKAAKVLGASTNSVSRELKELEVQLGCRLLYRTTRSVQLTEKGRIFLPKARNALKCFSALLSQSHDFIGADTWIKQDQLDIVLKRRGYIYELKKNYNVSIPNAATFQVLFQHLLKKQIVRESDMSRLATKVASETITRTFASASYVDLTKPSDDSLWGIMWSSETFRKKLYYALLEYLDS